MPISNITCPIHSDAVIMTSQFLISRNVRMLESPTAASAERETEMSGEQPLEPSSPLPRTGVFCVS